MEVVVAIPPPPPSSMDFNFDSTCSSPYITAPSSPQRFGNNNSFFFFSAPTSPTHIPHSTFFNPPHVSPSTFPPNTISLEVNSPEDEFEFDFDTHLQRSSLSADELFIDGKIKPFKPSSPSTIDKNKVLSHENEKMVTEELPLSSSLSRKLDEERAKSLSVLSTRVKSGNMNTSRSRNRVSECDDASPTQGGKNNSKTVETVSSTYSSFLSSISFTKGYRKWRIKDFLLFRSASEGRASDKDPLRKYAVLSKTTAHEDVRNLSFRSAESSGSVSRRRGPVSAHELHYKVNRAASVELKKKTLLPYKQGLLGCLGFNPGMHHFSTRFGTSQRSSL